MYSHVMIGTNDLGHSRAFYDTLRGTLGVPPGFVDGHGVFWCAPKGVFSVAKPINGEPATVANGNTIGFAAASEKAVLTWHAAGIAAGGTACEEPPGIRQGTVGKHFPAYLRDPEGHKLCALYRLPKG
jgi:catechol 2,3-dioxygenase-like lactoylglutathione lyase family enzyme